MRELILATGAIVTAMALSPGHAADVVPWKPYEVKTFAIADRGDLPGKLVDATVSLIGEPTAKTFGLSYQGTLEPNAKMTGTEKLLIYLYAACDDKALTGTTAINVGTIDIGTLKKGRQVSTTKEASALVPLSDVECAAIGMNAGEAEGAADKSYVVKTFAIADRGDLPGKLVDATVSLIGEPASKTFTLSYQGTFTPKVDMTGKETLVIYLDMNCDGQSPTGARAINVATIDIGTLKKGRQVSTLRATKDATVPVPLSDVGCAAIGMNAGEAEDAAAKSYVVKILEIPDPGDLPDLKLDHATASLIGAPDSTSFGLSFKGTLTPEVAMSGDEKLVLYLYTDCDAAIPSKTKGINVGTVDMGTLKKGQQVSTLIATEDAKAFVPLSQIGCAKVAIQ
jgi:hypothetical protein